MGLVGLEGDVVVEAAIEVVEGRRGRGGTGGTDSLLVDAAVEFKDVREALRACSGSRDVRDGTVL